MSGESSLVGQVLGGRYKLVKKLGEGGMGEVYAAEHVHIDKKFALKLLRPEIVSNKEAVSRFYQEARSSSSIGHRNIIGVEDFGELPDGRLYMCMELLNGAPLNDLITQPQPVERLLNIMIQTGHGLAAAHAKNIVHRDMKPENIYVTVGPNNDDIPKLLDFGIAKVAGNDGQNNLTRTGTIFGTPFYMAPEQALGNPVDGRTDIYAMGVIMYEVFAGSLPFQGESFMGILTQHITTDPEPVAHRAGKAGRSLPPGLAEVITRCMLKDPHQRFQTMDELVGALVNIYRGIAGAGMSTYMEAFPVAASASHQVPHVPPTGAHNMAKAQTMGVGGPPPGMMSPPHGHTPMQTPPAGMPGYGPSGGWQQQPSGTGPVPQASSSGSGVYGAASSSAVVPKKSSAGIIVAIVAVLAVGGGIAAFVVMSNKDEAGTDPGPGSQVAMADAGAEVTADASGGMVPETPIDAAGTTTADAATTNNVTPDAAVDEPPADAAVATVQQDAGSDTPQPTPDAAVAEPTTIPVELVTAAKIKFDIYENGQKIGEGPGTFELPKGTKKKLVLKAKGFKDQTISIDGKKKAVALSFAKIPSGNNTNGSNNPPPPKCSGTAADLKSTAPKGCGTLYCNKNSTDPRCLTYEP
ncbi:MAG: serine/threonine protein kinase [Kofleriaceae bacterium]